MTVEANKAVMRRFMESFNTAGEASDRIIGAVPR
jgi:hypothetical protein